MSTERFKLVSAVHLFLIKDNHVLLIRRFNTGYEDGNYGVPAGHIEGNEPIARAMAREALEEVGIVIKEDNLKVIHVMHRISNDGRNDERVDFFLTATHWDGEAVNKEPEKCDEVNWYSLDALPLNVIPYITFALEKHQAGEFYSEL